MVVLCVTINGHAVNVRMNFISQVVDVLLAL